MAHSNDKLERINEMSGLKTMVVNGELESVKRVLGNKKLNELEVGYLVDLAELNNDAEMVKLLEQYAE